MNSTQESIQSSQRQIFKSARGMSFGVLLSRLTGLLREQVFAAFFGATASMDAFQIAFRIPNLLRDLFAEGALSQAFIPQFQRMRLKEGAYRTQRFLFVCTISLLLVVTCISIGGCFFAETLVTWYAPSFKQYPEKFQLTVLLTKILFGFFPPISLAALWMAALNSLGMFFLPAAASGVFNLTSVGFGLLFVFVFKTYTQVDPIAGMAIGVVCGGVGQAVVQWPWLRKSGFPFIVRKEPEDSFGWFETPGLKSAARMMIPGFVGLAATQINILFTSILATSFGHGAVSWLAYAFRLMQLPIGLFGVSLGSATLSKVAELRAGSAPTHEVRSVLTKTLERSLFLNLSASVGLFGASDLIVKCLFEYGVFKELDTLNTALALRGYSVGLAAYSVVKLLAPCCYALGRVRVTVLASALSIFVSLSFSYGLRDQLGFSGLALGTALGAFVNAGVLYLALRAYLDSRAIFSTLAKLAPALLGAFWSMSQVQLEGYFGLDLMLSRWSKLGLVGFVGCGILATLAFGMGVEDVKNTVFRILRKKSQKKS